MDRSGWPRDGVEGSAPVTVGVPPGPGLRMRLLADGSLLELFVADRATVTERVYRRPDDVAELLVEGDAEVSAWEQVPPRRG
ncbi:GH32 C-terminal domain-containing protein [Streptomyces sp. NPDC004658]|uniref:GH32 C-terminal domain-containing protein n=1 Tax=Streptomyces sp. NPDC004658 TaxID=3154672 RepID=UPI0033A5C9E0